MIEIKKMLLLILLPVILIHAGCSSETTAFRSAAEINSAMGRGVNMGNSFEAPSEDAWNNPWNPDYFRIMAEIGFSHVRVPIRWTTDQRSMEEPPYTISPEFMTRIETVVNTAIKNGLHVIINMHHHHEIFEHPLEEKDRFLALWTQISENFKSYPDSLVFEILNEPNNELTPELWNDFMKEALQIIRNSNPQRAVMIGTADWGGLRELPQLAWPDDHQLILTLHYYEPFEFTHQNAGWVGEFTKNWLGTTWDNTLRERQAIKDKFAFTLEFSESRNIPVNIGEFGSIVYADPDSRVRWTNFLARWFEEQNFSWTYWEFSAYHYGFYKPETGEFNLPLKNGLLHNPMPELSEPGQ